MSEDPFAGLTPLRVRLSQHATNLRDRIEAAESIVPLLDSDYVIKSWITRCALSIVYGASNSGKSFWAIDVAHHVQEGLDWGGHRVRRGEVLYVAAEGGRMFDNRIAARNARFKVLRGPIALAGSRSEAQPLAEAIMSVACESGPFSLIVIDTMARVMAGADENSAADISGFVRSLDLLRERTGAHIMVVHHTGKDEGKGARGHSSLRAAIDTEIEISKDKDTGFRVARATKQRDLQGGAEKEFVLRIVELGKDEDGDAVTSCIVEHLKGD